MLLSSNRNNNRVKRLFLCFRFDRCQSLNHSPPPSFVTVYRVLRNGKIEWRIKCRVSKDKKRESWWKDRPEGHPKSRGWDTVYKRTLQHVRELPCRNHSTSTCQKISSRIGAFIRQFTLNVPSLYSLLPERPKTVPKVLNRKFLHSLSLSDIVTATPHRSDVLVVTVTTNVKE